MSHSSRRKASEGTGGFINISHCLGVNAFCLFRGGKLLGGGGAQSHKMGKMFTITWLDMLPALP
jgi:hypothetical protein